MTTYSTLSKIIPPDQALANQALSRSLRQIKDIFNADLPAVANAVGVLESNKDLTLINSLQTPLPSNVIGYWSNTFATGTGPGNTITTDDVIGIAAGATVNTQLPTVTSVLQNLANIGALNSLTANGGTPTSSTNGVYTVMEYCLAGAYTSVIDPGPPVVISITIPSPLPGAGTYSSYDEAFGNGLIPAANTAITSIATTYSEQANISNQATSNIASQMAINVTNCVSAGIDIANLVSNISNANLQSNSTSTLLNFTSSLHTIGLDISVGGAAQFVQAVANTSTLAGQAVIASMREGRNIEALNSVGIMLDTQLSAVSPDPQIDTALIANAQYSVSEARANISF